MDCPVHDWCISVSVNDGILFSINVRIHSKPSTGRADYQTLSGMDGFFSSLAKITCFYTEFDCVRRAFRAPTWRVAFDFCVYRNETDAYEMVLIPGSPRIQTLDALSTPSAVKSWRPSRRQNWYGYVNPIVSHSAQLALKCTPAQGMVSDTKCWSITITYS